jgi:hypothetical protein
MLNLVNVNSAVIVIGRLNPKQKILNRKQIPRIAEDSEREVNEYAFSSGKVWDKIANLAPMFMTFKNQAWKGKPLSAYAPAESEILSSGR